jgi:hypothetical protein
MAEDKSVEALRAELELQKAALKKLQDQLNPPPREPYVMPRFDYTANASMSPDTMREFGKAAGGGVVMRQNERVLRQKLERIKQEFSAPTKPPAAHEPQPTQRGTGWRDEIPLGPPPGIEHCDRMLDAQDAKDRAELIERELKLAKDRRG